MHRFFVQPTAFAGQDAHLTGPIVHQMLRVLRLNPGDRVILLDDSGWSYESELVSLDPDLVLGRIVRKTLVLSEPRAKITLFQGVLKANRLEFVLQKGTELGIVSFVPIITQRCVMSNLDAVGPQKTQRWKRIIREAAEQSGRGRLPRLRSVELFAQAYEQARKADLSIIPWERERMTNLRDLFGPSPGSQKPFSINVFVGPEGGFTTDEIELAQSHGIKPITLGPRTLRAETAGLVASTAILYALGDLE